MKCSEKQKHAACYAAAKINAGELGRGDGVRLASTESSPLSNLRGSRDGR
jgi:hypothetical protein